MNYKELFDYYFKLDNCPICNEKIFAYKSNVMKKCDVKIEKYLYHFYIHKTVGMFEINTDVFSIQWRDNNTTVVFCYTTSNNYNFNYIVPVINDFDNKIAKIVDIG